MPRLRPSAGQGRITVLTPHLDREWTLSTLVELTDGQGRDEQILQLIAPRAERARSTRGQEGWCFTPATPRNFRLKSWSAGPS